MKTVREEGHYTIKRVKKLPKKGNQNWLYALVGDTISEFYRWSFKTRAFETIKLGTSISGSQQTDVIYDSNTGSLTINFADGSSKNVTLSTGSTSTAAPSFIVSLSAGESYGKYKSGETVPAFSTIQEQVRDIGQKPVIQTFTEPSLSILASPINNTALEVGTTINISLSSVFTQNDAGPAIQTKYLKNNIDLLSATDTIILTESDITYTANTTYTAGSGTKLDVLGNIYPNTILAGSKYSASVSYKGYKPVFYGDTSVKYTTSTDIRTLTKGLVNSDSFTLETGNTNTIFQFWLPTGTNLVSVVHENINDDITLQFSQESLTINDINGTPMAGTLYTYSIDVVFTQSEQFKITKS